MAELLISSRRTSPGKDDLLSLMDRLNLAIPDAEPVLDKERLGGGSGHGSLPTEPPSGGRGVRKLGSRHAIIRISRRSQPLKPTRMTPKTQRLTVPTT